VEVTAQELAPAIRTVGVLELSSDLSASEIEEAVVEFGTGGDLTFSAPVDLDAPNYRTLLLGMRPSTEYQYRVVVRSATTECTAEGTITTGTLPAGAPANSVVTAGTSSAAPEPGFIVTAVYSGAWVLILDGEGYTVWAHQFSPPSNAGIGAARMSYDGHSMIASSLNPSGTSGLGYLYRVNMDGTGAQMVSLATSHHDFTPLPNGGVAYLSKEGSVGSSGPCDAVRELSADFGSNELVYDLWDAVADFDAYMTDDLCHANSIRYNAADDSLTVSERNRYLLLKLTRGGELVWTLGGSDGSITPDVTWERQYGHHMIDPAHLLLFSNGPTSGNPPGIAIELELDTEAHTATEVWEYQGELGSVVLGDVQRLSGGNTLVTYSTEARIQEVAPDKTLVRDFDLSVTPAAGYASFRPTLYGAPP
jgi:hypothetical protein